MRAASKNSSAAPEFEAASQFILDFLQERGEVLIKDLDDAAAGAFVSVHTLRRAKEQLKRDGIIQTLQKGFGKEKSGIFPCCTLQMDK